MCLEVDELLFIHSDTNPRKIDFFRKNLRMVEEPISAS